VTAMDGNGQGPAGKKSIVDEGTTFKGAITSNTTVVVRGVVEGEISGPAVEVEAGGVMVGKAKVTELRSRGELAGEYDADDVELTGRVRDGTVIRAKALLVAPASSYAREGEQQPLFGECQIEVGDPPSKEQAVARELANTRAAGSSEPPRPVVQAMAAEGEGGANGPGPRRKRTPTERTDTGV
jgi:cytoskeletal protein CcmA (bactofilin family)